MGVPYLLVADIHAHQWSAFATTNANGLNSRLEITLNELDRASDELLKRGGRRMLIAGDLFHVRGSVDPEVFNPTHAMIKRIVDKRICVEAIPGNHDLKDKETNEIGNAMQTFGEIRGGGTCAVVHVETAMVQVCITDRPGLVMIPWCSTREVLEKEIARAEEAISPMACKNYDLIIHAGIDGVLPGMPGAGLTPAAVAEWGFNRVFAGHYHNHKEMDGGKVVSIGATTHQTWSDIGTKAGFVFVYPDHIEWQASHAPEFVEITGETEPDEIPLIVDGNYVRVRSMKLTDAEINSFRSQLTEMGARGVTFQVAREAVSRREGVAAGSAATLDESVSTYIDKLPEIDTAAVKLACADILSTVRSVEA